MKQLISSALGLLLLAAGCAVSENRIPQGVKTEDGILVKKDKQTEEQWKIILSPEQYNILRKGGTERAFTGKYNNYFEDGVYVCAACGNPLFNSAAKYDHGTGWPSFTAAVDDSRVEYHEDYSLFVKRVEVRCASCGSHLGHVFDDGPQPTKKHYCINSASLEFFASNSTEAGEIERILNSNLSGNTTSAIFAAGCFWGVEYKFSQLKGVISTRVGYTGGEKIFPTYQEVCSKDTGHAEAVEIRFNPEIITYEELLAAFFQFHDPTHVNRQGPDIGDQYRSAVFYQNDGEKAAAEKMIAELNASGQFRKPIATQIVSAGEFYKAEEYHQKYYEKNHIKK